VTWLVGVHADVAVLAVRLGAKDLVTLANFYETAFGLKEIDRVRPGAVTSRDAAIFR
jgi:hypothetical protein